MDRVFFTSATLPTFTVMAVNRNIKAMTGINIIAACPACPERLVVSEVEPSRGEQNQKKGPDQNFF